MSSLFWYKFLLFLLRPSLLFSRIIEGGLQSKRRSFRPSAQANEKLSASHARDATPHKCGGLPSGFGACSQFLRKPLRKAKAHIVPPCCHECLNRQGERGARPICLRRTFFSLRPPGNQYVAQFPSIDLPGARMLRKQSRPGEPEGGRTYLMATPYGSRSAGR